MIHHGMVEDCPVSTHDLYLETVIWNKSLGDLKEKETRRSPEGGHYVCSRFTFSHMYSYIARAVGGDSRVKFVIVALLKALRERTFVPISLLSDGEGAIALCVDVMRSLGVRFNPAGSGQHVLRWNEAFRPSSLRSKGF